MSKENTELKKAGLKATLPRIRILEALESSDHNRHLSAEEIYKQLINSGEDVGLATIYRVLTQFESAGIVIRHNFEEGHAVYEITPDDHHDHDAFARATAQNPPEFPWIPHAVDDGHHEHAEHCAYPRGFRWSGHTAVEHKQDPSND